jgi:hypothetical protein
VSLSKRNVRLMLIHVRLDELKRHHHQQNYPGNPWFWIACKDAIRWWFMRSLSENQRIGAGT